MDPLAHASIGLMVKPLVPKAPLWALVAATQIPDALSLALIATGIERGADTQMDFEHGLRYLSPSSIPWSHGLFMSIVWSTGVGAIAFYFCRDRRTSLALGLLVFSHWLLDFLVYLHLPLLLDRGPTGGLGLITTRRGLIGGILLEIVLISSGIAVYLFTRKPAPLKRKSEAY